MNQLSVVLSRIVSVIKTVKGIIQYSIAILPLVVTHAVCLARQPEHRSNLIFEFSFN